MSASTVYVHRAYMYTCMCSCICVHLHVHVHVHCIILQHRMTKMVKKHLSKKHVIQEEDLLEKIADSTDRSEHITCIIMYMYIN